MTRQRRSAAPQFLARTDPLVVSAMRKVCVPGTGHRDPLPLTRAERAALDGWLKPRLDALPEIILHDGLMLRSSYPPRKAA